MWTFNTRTGLLAHDGTFEGTGYSGTGSGRNDPSWEHVRNKGPIPRGLWHIGPDTPHAHLVSPVLPLHPDPSTETFGRAGFLIHGDNKQDDASHGCIILGPALRRLILGSGDNLLKVEA